MKIKEFKDELLGESVYCAKLPSGLEIRICAKPDYDSAYALFGVKYGSIDTYLGNDDGTYTAIPEGTAHFLEHKLFESEELDAFELFAKTGAYANAYTSFEKTAYLFKGSNNIETSLGYLLEFVQSPFFTAETVQKEQGIIGQEIRMYQDVPDWVVMFNLLKCLYATHPVRIDIAGTQESIARIDDKLLYKLYNTYYNPSNMMLSIAGKVDPEKIIDQISKSIKIEGKPVPPRKYEQDVPEVVSDYIEEKLSVGKKMFLFGYKEYITVPELTIKQELATEIMLDAVFGKSTPFFKKLLDAKLIDMDFCGSLFNGFGFSTVMIGGTSDDPEKVVSLIKEEVARVKAEGIPVDRIERARRKIYGRFVMDYNDIDSIANCQLSLCFGNYEPFADFEAIRDLKVEDVYERLEILNEERSALSVVLPI